MKAKGQSRDVRVLWPGQGPAWPEWTGTGFRAEEPQMPGQSVSPEALRGCHCLAFFPEWV